MLFESLHHGLDDIQPLIKTLIFESECSPQSQFSVHSPSNLTKQGNQFNTSLLAYKLPKYSIFLNFDVIIKSSISSVLLNPLWVWS